MLKALKVKEFKKTKSSSPEQKKRNCFVPSFDKPLFEKRKLFVFVFHLQNKQLLWSSSVNQIVDGEAKRTLYLTLPNQEKKTTFKLCHSIFSLQKKKLLVTWWTTLLLESTWRNFYWTTLANQVTIFFFHLFCFGVASRILPLLLFLIPKFFFLYFRSDTGCKTQTQHNLFWVPENFLKTRLFVKFWTSVSHFSE